MPWSSSTGRLAAGGSDRESLEVGRPGFALSFYRNACGFLAKHLRTLISDVDRVISIEKNTAFVMSETMPVPGGPQRRRKFR
jgi:hypothetical protein